MKGFKQISNTKYLMHEIYVDDKPVYQIRSCCYDFENLKFITQVAIFYENDWLWFATKETSNIQEMYKCHEDTLHNFLFKQCENCKWFKPWGIFRDNHTIQEGWCKHKSVNGLSLSSWHYGFKEECKFWENKNE